MGIYGKPRCSMGTLASAHRKTIWNPKVASLMYHALYRQLNGITLTEFNTRAEKNDVILLFEQAAKSLRK
jgi:hypothetical protein